LDSACKYSGRSFSPKSNPNGISLEIGNDPRPYRKGYRPVKNAARLGARF